MDSAERVRHLLAQRERLLGEIQNEELAERAEQANGRRHVAEAESKEKEHQEAAMAQRSIFQLAEDALAGSPKSPTALGSGDVPSADLMQAEVRAVRDEVESARTARAALMEERAASEKQKVEDWVSAIRMGSQENQALQANQQMAHAHLKALEAMAVSSAGQVRVREAALSALLQQVQEQEAVAHAVRCRAEAAETQLEFAVAELRAHKAITSPSSWASARVREHEELLQEHNEVEAEVMRLQRENAVAEEHLQATRRNLFPEDGLQSSVAQLRAGYQAAVDALHEAMRRPSLLEADVARLTTEMLEEERIAADLEAISNSAAVERLMAEEDALRAELDAREMDIRNLQLEAAEQDQTFTTMVNGLQDQVASLTTEEMQQAATMRGSLEEAGAAAQNSTFMNTSAITANTTRLDAPRPPFSTGALASSAAQVDPLMDPGRGLDMPTSSSTHLLPQTTTSLPGPHRPHWRELEQGWRPTNPGLQEARRPASHSPSAGSRLPLQTDPGLMRSSGWGARSNMAASSSYNAGSPDNSHLFLTHHHSLDSSNMFRTPLVGGQAQRASPMATTQRRGPEPPWQAADETSRRFEPWQPGSGAARGSSPPRRARTPPPRLPPSMPNGARHAGDMAYQNGSSMASLYGVARDSGHGSHNEREAAFQARMAELKGVIGASLQSLDEEEVADAQQWRAARARALVERQEAIWGLQAAAAHDTSSLSAIIPGAASRDRSMLGAISH